MKFELPPLPYAQDALAPHISGNTLSFHYGKHHQAYMDKLKAAIEGKPEADQSLDELVRTATGGVFNNAAQVWNHSFYWNSMKPQGGGDPTGELLSAIERDFGSVADFKQQFSQAAATHFGSGWAWLVSANGKLEIVDTHDADNPLRHGKTPLLTIDVWEHAYYLDYQNARPNYIKAYVEHLVNWDFAAENLGKAK